MRYILLHEIEAVMGEGNRMDLMIPVAWRTLAFSGRVQKTVDNIQDAAFSSV